MDEIFENRKYVIAAIDLGAHSARMLIAECDPETYTFDTLEELEVPTPLGSDVFRTGVVSDSSVRMLCEIFGNFKTKMAEYDVEYYKAIATSAVREASNSGVLIERIHHYTGIELMIFEGTDEARLDYFAVRNSLDGKFPFDTKSTLIADIGTGACQVSSYESGKLLFTETIKVGTLRVLELMPESLSEGSIRGTLTPVINKSFSELEHIASSLKSDYIIAMGTSVRALLRICGKPGTPGCVISITKEEFERFLADLANISLDAITDTYGVSKELAETVVPCSVILDNLFNVTGASTLVVPFVAMKQGLLQDFMNELFSKRDFFSEQIFSMVRATAAKYRADNEYTLRTVTFAEKLFARLADIHGCSERDLVLLKIAAYLHKTGLFINNQAYHKHSFYIINSTEIPGLSDSERMITALIARYHRKTSPKGLHFEYAALPQNHKNLVLKLSAILRIACALAQSGGAVGKLRIRTTGEIVDIRFDDLHALFDSALVSADADYFGNVFAMRLIMK